MEVRATLRKVLEREVPTPRSVRSVHTQTLGTVNRNAPKCSTRMMSYRSVAGEKRECQYDALRVHFAELSNVQLDIVTLKFSEYVERSAWLRG